MLSKIYYRMSVAEHNSQCQNFVSSHWIPCSPTDTILDSTEICVSVEASEDSHLSLENNPAVHTMSLLISGNPLCADCVAALSSYGVTSTDNMYAASKKLSAVSPGLRATRL